MSRIVIQMHGLPGSGKSTVARAIGSELRAVVLDKDVIKAALLRADISESQAAAGAYEVYFAQATDLVRLGNNVILDNPVFWPRVEANWHKLADEAECPRILIECVCADENELLRRLETRDSLESQQKTLYQPRSADNFRVSGDRLVLDTLCPLDDLVTEALAYIQSETSNLKPVTS